MLGGFDILIMKDRNITFCSNNCYASFNAISSFADITSRSKAVLENQVMLWGQKWETFVFTHNVTISQSLG